MVAGEIPMVLQVNKTYRGHRERLLGNPSESLNKTMTFLEVQVQML